MTKREKFRLKPIHPQGRGDIWFYEDPKGFHCYIQHYDSNGNRVTTDFLISRRTIMRYAEIVRSAK